MLVEQVYSPILDEDIHKHLKESPIWAKCYKKEEAPDGCHKYTIKFDGLIPIQVTKIEKNETRKC